MKSEVQNGNDAQAREKHSRVRPRLSKLAVASIVFAIGAWLTLLAVFVALALGAHIRGTSEVVVTATLFVCAVLGVVCGGIAVWVVWRSDGRLRGRLVAVAAMLLSIAALVAPPVLLPARGMPVKGDSCANHLRAICVANSIWQEKFGWPEKQYPRSLEALHNSGIIQDPKLFLCVDTGRKPKKGLFLTDYECILERAGLTITESMRTPEAPLSDVPLAWDKSGNHPDGFWVVHFDFGQRFIEDDEHGAARRKFLANVDAWIEKNRPKGNDNGNDKGQSSNNK